MMFNTIFAALLAVSTGTADFAQPIGTGTAAATKDAAAFTAFHAKRIYLGDGTSIEDGVVLVQDGVIVRVGVGLEVPDGATIIQHDGAISAGLIASRSGDGAGGELNDGTRKVMPAAQARHAYDPGHAEMKKALEAGITSIVLAPSSTRLIGGQTAVVKTSGGTVVKASAQLALGMSSDALGYSEFPTSFGGAMGELNKQFSDPKGSVSKAVTGAMPVLMDVNDQAQTMRAIAFAKKYNLKGALCGSYWAENIATHVKASGLDVVCTPFDLGDGQRGTRSVLALAKAGVRLGFGLDAPARNPKSLRLGAAMCVRAGLSADKARRALTGDAAAIAGVAGRIGRVARGLDADLVLWSGDPVSLTSSIKAVYIEGGKVFGGTK
ncbi:MAG: imidazolonepropionase-like amidohydrolase [Planctomycetota bacterium]|jgi:imidazolonepropionase-like amidohydrolase